jgi:hypothetical protein
VIPVIDQFLILVDVVQHMPQPHFGLHPLFSDLFWVGQSALLMELLLDSRQQLETVLGGIVLHALQELAVDHAERQLFKGLQLAPVHR